MSSHIRQILIAGAGTAAWWNAGDEAILSSMLQELRAQFPGVEIGVISANPKGALDVYQVQEIPVSDISALIEFARQSDLLVLGGGGLFYDYWGFEVENLLTESQGGAGIYVGFALLATLLEKPLMIYAVGVGPLFSDTGKHYTCLAFEQARAITVRDGESKELLISIGIPPEKIRVTADPVWRFPEISLDSGESLLQQMEVTASSPLLGVSVRPWTNPGGEEWESEVARALDDFIEQHGGKVLFIPFHKSDGVVDDHAQSEKVRGLMKHADSARILDADLSLEKKVSVLRCCDLVLGMRLHANIFAMRYRIPAVGLAYDPKVTNLFTEVGKPGFSVDLRLVNAESLQFVLGQAYKEKEALQSFYRQLAEAMAVQAKKNINLAASLVKTSQPSRKSSLPANTAEWMRALLLQYIAVFQAKQAEMQAKQAEMQAKQAEMQAKQVDNDRIIVALQAQLTAITSSVSWKLIQRVSRIRLWLAPQGSWRERVFQLGLRSLLLWKREGIIALTRVVGRKTSRWLRIFFDRIFRNRSDLSWEKFQATVLSNRHLYKGIFIQEPVIDWNVPLYQRPQHIAAALGRLGYLVIYKTPKAVDDVNGFQEVSKNVWLTNLPVPSIGKAVFSVYSTAYATASQVIANGISREGVFVYEYIDHISPLISGNDENIRNLLNLKQFAIKNADFVVASARLLEHEAVDAMGREKVLYIPNGVDVDHYRNPRHENTRVPKSSFMGFRRRFSTLVGYFGAIAPWLWFEMIDELVNLRPDIGFVFIGSDYHGGVAQLPKKQENFLYLGHIDYKVLPAYARLFDICFIPFAPGDIARTTSPLKLFEYFALEKPVVVTSFMDECLAFEEVFSGNSVQSISAAIDVADKIKDDPTYKANLALLADQNSWDERARAYEAVFYAHGASGFFHAPEHPLSHIQSLIADCYKRDGLDGSYYETTYSKQEYFYWQPVLEWMMEIPSVSSVIDIGAAYGTLLVFSALNKKAKILHAVDPVGYMSKSLLKEFGITLHSVDFERSDFEYDEKFDLVIFTEVIEHLNFQPHSTLQKIRRLMHKDSCLILSTPDAAEWGRTTKYYSRLKDIPSFDGQATPWIDDHIWQYEKDELDEILRTNGFRIEKFEYAPGASKRHLCYLLKLA